MLGDRAIAALQYMGVILHISALQYIERCVFRTEVNILEFRSLVKILLILLIIA